jgi:alpha-L-fucosidase
MGGNLMLNVSPMGDGSIPDVQQQALLAIGDWLRIYGDGIYGSRPWVIMGEGPMIPPQPPGDWKGGSTAVEGPRIGRQNIPPPSEADFRFTVAKGAVYAFGYKRPATEARLASFPAGKARVERVTLPGDTAPLRFHQTAESLIVSLPVESSPSRMPYGLRIEGSLPLGVGGS